jgi:hypothetical protein
MTMICVIYTGELVLLGSEMWEVMMGWVCSYVVFGLFTGLAKSEDKCVRHRAFGSDRQTNKTASIPTDALKHVARTTVAGLKRIWILS